MIKQEETSNNKPLSELYISKIDKLYNQISKVIIGKRETIKLLLTALFAQGHILIEDVPGVGKTTLARVLAKSIQCSFQRIQFTPDLLPSDVLGVSIYNSKIENFDFKKGPIFANVVLADEINRATPRTQSSLLEAMNDFQVSVDGKTYLLPSPFIVMATQNPIEFRGTYPLPESQLDRFLMKIKMGYPDFQDEKDIMYSQKVENPLDNITPVITGEEISEIQKFVRSIKIDDKLIEYILTIVNETRKHEKIKAGVSPRGSLAIMRAAQAFALISGRDFCIPDDIKYLAVPLLAHRIVQKGTFFSSSDENWSERLILDILDKIPVVL